jgi:hypothetical protein
MQQGIWTERKERKKKDSYLSQLIDIAVGLHTKDLCIP